MTDPILTLVPKLTALLMFLMLFQRDVSAEIFELDVQSQVRMDIRDHEADRFQYRFRVYSQYQAPIKGLSLKSFLATGDDFDSSHNSFDGDHRTDFHLRRLFVSVN